MKKVFAFLLAVTMLMTLTACGKKKTTAPATIPGDNPPMAEDIADPGLTLEDDLRNQERAQELAPNQEIDLDWEAQQDSIYEYGIDLSMYDDHGQWSSDRMWVKKLESSWDKAEAAYFGYIDRNGDLVGQWHEKGYILYSDKEGLENFANDTAATALWNKPADFSGNYAVVSCGDCTEVIDLNGNTVVKYVYFSASSWEPQVFQIEDDLQIHVYCPKDDSNNLHMLRIQNGRATDIAVTTDDSMYMPPYVRMRNDTFTYCFYSSVLEKSDYCTFDLNGNLLVQGTTTYEVTNVYPATDGSATAALIFVGADKNEWLVEVDAQGTWLTEPTAY